MKNYLSFFCFSEASFIVRIASSLETGCAFFLISLHTCSRSLPSNGLNIFFLGFFTNKQLVSGKDIEKTANKKASDGSLKLEKIFFDGIQIGHFCVQKKYFGLIAAYNDLQKTLFRSESNQVVINTMLGIFRKGFPFGSSGWVLVDFGNFLNCDFLALEKTGIKAAEIKVEGHSNGILSCNPCFEGCFTIRYCNY